MVRMACIPACGFSPTPCKLDWFLPICWCPGGGAASQQATAPDTSSQPGATSQEVTGSTGTEQTGA